MKLKNFWYQFKPKTKCRNGYDRYQNSIDKEKEKLYKVNLHFEKKNIYYSNNLTKIFTFYF